MEAVCQIPLPLARTDGGDHQPQSRVETKVDPVLLRFVLGIELGLSFGEIGLWNLEFVAEVRELSSRSPGMELSLSSVGTMGVTAGAFFAA